jgi:hypothetical protein
LPFRASPAAREMLVEVLPVPPFWLAIEMIISRQLTQKPSRGFPVSFFISITYNDNAIFYNMQVGFRLER